MKTLQEKWLNSNFSFLGKKERDYDWVVGVGLFLMFLILVVSKI